MAVRVRVQNFQSIEDATLEIDGLTAITGTNNSGKTAVMRAIRGVFTNAPAGPLVRHGCAHLTVTLTFDDGTTIVWEKGWEKPGRKGKTVNQYTINGMKIATVGRGVPPEVEALGVREVRAASDRVWPQIASQHTGNLFLVDRPGSAVAEALSDVERVGKLTAALKSSEKDRRAVNSELKVRRKDVEVYKTEVSKFDGLDVVGGEIRDLDVIQKDLFGRQKSDLDEVSDLLGRHQTASSVTEALAGFDPDVVPDQQHAEKLSDWSRKIGVVQGYSDQYTRALASTKALESFDPTVVPDSQRVEKLQRAVETVGDYRDQHRKARGVVDALDGFSGVVIPDADDLVSRGQRIETVRTYAVRHQEAADLVQSFADFVSPDLPGSDLFDDLRESIESAISLRDRLNVARENLEELKSNIQQTADDLAEAEADVIRLLGDRGVCPTCNTVHEGGHA